MSGSRGPKRHAAGLPAVLSTLRHTIEQMGLGRTAQTLARVNQHGGFDCPGCAWPEPKRPHLAEFCENGAKAVAAEATRRRAGPDFFAAHPVADLATRSEHWLGRAGRLTHPMYLAPGSGRYAPISWDNAFEVIARELSRLSSPDEAIFYTSGRTSNEAAFLWQLFVRGFGTNNLPDCSNMCHESSGAALTETIGIGKGSVTLEDVESADLIFVVGQNPGTNHPRMLSALEQAKRGGARIVAVNPLPEPGLLRFKNPQRPSSLAGRGTQLADLFLQVRLNGDLGLFKALSRLLLDADRSAPGSVLDGDFIGAHCEGFEMLERHLDELDWDEACEAAGLRREEIEAAAAMARQARSIVVCWAMGLTQHRNAVATIREVVNFLLLGGNIGRPGAGLCPVRGHSNVQGDRTMGITEKPDSGFLNRLGASLGFEPPRRDGFDVVESIRAMDDGRAHVFMAMGGNFVAAAPDTEATARSLRAQTLTVHVSTKLNRSHTVCGRHALILPTLGRSERDVQGGVAQLVSVEDSMGIVHASQGTLPAASEHLLSEVAIVCRLARRVLGDRIGVDWDRLCSDYSVVRDLIEQVVPGFEQFNERVAQPGGFRLPHPPRDERRFQTPSGRARFTVNPLEPIRLPAGRLLLQSLRSHDQYNTTVYALNDRYRGIRAGRRVVLVNPADLEALGQEDGDLVDLVSEWTDGVERRAARFRVVAYPTARGCAAAYFPEANALVPLDHTAEVSNTPASKSVVVRLEPATAREGVGPLHAPG